MIANVEEIVDRLQVKLGVTAEALSDEGYELAADSALKELGWAIPISHPLKEFWVLERALRHSIFILSTEAARKFKYKQISLNQRFEHYNKLLEKMDADFRFAKEENPDLFADCIYMDDDIIKRWITYIPNQR